MLPLLSLLTLFLLPLSPSISPSLSAAVVMAADVAIPTPQQVLERLAEYEEEFKHRYTKRDEGYKNTVSRGSR